MGFSIFVLLVIIYIVLKVMGVLVGLCVDVEIEFDGLDISEYGEVGYCLGDGVYVGVLVFL